MSAPIESIVDETDVSPVELEEGSESVDLSEKLRDKVDGATVDDEANSGGDPKGSRKRKSDVWQHFKDVQVMVKGKLVPKAECRYCKKRYMAPAGCPTTNLWRHSKKCGPMRRVKGKNQGLINFKSGDNTTVHGFNFNSDAGYDQLKCRKIIAKMIIAHELPFTFIEYQWFNVLLKYICPIYQRVSRSTIKSECIKVYEWEKEKLKKVFKSVDRISLTSDCWTSNQTIGYMCLTAHYIDSDWKLQKRIISFNELAPPRSGEGISDAILESLMKWGIQDKIGTITLDNAANNDRAADILKSNFYERGKLHFDGLFFHVRCCAHILNLVVQDGLSEIDACIWKIRDGVKYLKKSPARLLKFGEMAKGLGIQTSRSLCCDVKTRWNSTHRMLESALHYKSTFYGYQLRDNNFKWLPTEDEWIRVRKVCKLLEAFLDATNLFSSTLYPTANLFLVEIFKVKKVICEAYASNDPFLKKMSIPMYEKFEKYWGEIGVLMSIASILDPRFKMVSVEFTFERLYPSREFDNRVEEVANKLKTLYEKYSEERMAARLATKAVASTSNSAAAAARTERVLPDDDFYAFLKTRGVEKPPKSELEVYLEEPIYDVEDEGPFDVLKWWNNIPASSLL